MIDDDIPLKVERFLRERPLSPATHGEWTKVVQTIARNISDGMFLSQVELFLGAHSLTPTTFGLWAMDDSRFVFDLRTGRCCSGHTKARVLRFMIAYEAKQETKRQRLVAIQHEQT